MTKHKFLKMLVEETSKHKKNSFNRKVEEIKKEILERAKVGSSWVSVDFYYPQDDLIVQDVMKHFEDLGLEWAIHCADGASSTHCLHFANAVAAQEVV